MDKKKHKEILRNSRNNEKRISGGDLYDQFVEKQKKIDNGKLTKEQENSETVVLYTTIAEEEIDAIEFTENMHKRIGSYSEIEKREDGYYIQCYFKPIKSYLITKDVFFYNIGLAYYYTLYCFCRNGSAIRMPKELAIKRISKKDPWNEDL